MESPTDTRLFRNVAIAWIVGAPVAFFVLPLVFAAVWGVPPDFPIGARLSLVAAWLTLVLCFVGLINLGRLFTESAPVELNTPQTVMVWLRAAALGVAALEFGFIIATTIFR